MDELLAKETFSSCVFFLDKNSQDVNFYPIEQKQSTFSLLEATVYATVTSVDLDLQCLILRVVFQLQPK